MTTLDPFDVAADLFDPPIDPYLHEPERWVADKLGEHLWSVQVRIMRAVLEHRRVAVPSCHGPGKALALDTPLPTPTGWTTMGDVVPGDLLLDEDGKPCTVTNVSPIEVRAAYQVRFGDGSSIVASADHEWNVIDLRHRPRRISDWRDHWAATSTWTTAALAANPRAGGQHRWHIPTARPLATTEPWPLACSPYTFGAWLGDGTTIRAEITCHEDDAAHFAAEFGGHIRAGRKDTTRIVTFGERRYIDAPSRATGGMKQIPNEVQRALPEHRFAVLQGLMDTDGNATRSGEVEIAVCSELLADGIYELVVGLGFVARRSSRAAKIDGRAVGTSHRILFRPDRCPFRLERKAATWASSALSRGQRSRHTQRTIVAVECVPAQPVKCVVVDSPRHLFLAGRAMIPTHNSYTAARVLAHWIDAHPAGQARAVSSAPTDPQVKAILWDEVKGVHGKADLAGRVTLDARWVLNDRLVAFGRKPADIPVGDGTGTVTAFQGIHGRFMLVVFDESTGIPKPLWTAANSLLTNEDACFLAIGNPDDPLSEFARVCAGADPVTGGLSDLGWYVIPISIFDTPNFTDEPVPDELRHYLPTQTWLDTNAMDWGGEALVEEARRIAAGGTVDDTCLAWSNPLFMSKALGRFPSDSTDGTIPWSWLQRCRGDEATRRIGELRVPVELGVDVGASDNGDYTIIRERRGMKAGRRWSVQSSDPEVVAAKIVEAAREAEPSRVKVDAIGVGWALVSLVRRDLRGVQVDPIVVSEAAEPGPNGEQYANLRAALWWEIGRTLSKQRAWDLTDLDERTLVDLSAPRWREDKSGRIVIEDKADVRKRIGRSPDDGDALLLAFYTPPASGEAKHVEVVDQRLRKGRRAR